MVAATAIPMARSVITVSAPLGTDFSARNSVIRTMIPKNPAAANVSHIGKAGERQSWSSDVAQAQFMRDVPQRSIKSIPRNRMPDLPHLAFRRMVLRTGRFDGGRNRIRFTPPCARLFFGNGAHALPV